MSIPERLGKYEVERLLGRGAFGEVYLCRHPGLAVPRAIKLLYAGPDESEAVREAVLQARLDHEHIVRILDVESQEGRPFLVMEYVAGGDLARAVKVGLGLGQSLDIARGLAMALDHAHGLGIIHRDLKPANVLLTPDGRPKIADFGLARLLTRDQEHHTRLAGTAPYLAPEQLTGTASAASDMWAFGCIIFEMINGKPPFGGESDFEIMKAIAEAPLPALKGAPAQVARMVSRLLDREPAARPQAAEVFRALNRLHAKRTTIVGGVVSRTMEADDWPCFKGGPDRTASRGEAPAPPLAEVWSFEAGAPVMSSPAICRGRVYLGDSAGALHALDLLSGRLAWRHRGSGSMYPSPVAVGTAVLAATHAGEVAALKASDGALIWQGDLGAALAATPLAMPEGIFVGDLDGRVHQLDPVDGRAAAAWQSEGGVEAGMVATQGLVIWGTLEGEVVAADPKTRQVAWNTWLGAGLEAAPAAWQGRVHLIDVKGGVYCLDALTGAMGWRVSLGCPCFAAPAVAGGDLLVATADGLLVCLDAATGSEKWRRDLGAPVTASPALADGMAAVADRAGGVTLLERSGGRVLQKLELAAGAHSSPAIWRGLLITADMAGTVKAFGSGRETRLEGARGEGAGI